MNKNSPKWNLDLENKTRWYVVANRTDAVFYAEAPNQQFRFTERLSNENGRLLEKEFDSDKAGRGFSSPGKGVGHSLDRRSKHHEQAAKKFAIEIAEVLENARKQDRFGELVLVAGPHFMGLLRDALKPETRGLVRHEVCREFYQGSDDLLRDQVLKALAAET